MQPQTLRWVYALLLVTAVGAAVADAAPALQVGGRLTALAIGDQHDSSHRIDESTRVILFSTDMDGNDLTKEALADGGRALLAKAGAAYVADISRMPGIITRLFALPAMRKRDYPMLLDRDGELTRSWPRREAQVAVIELDRLTVTRIDFLTSASAVRERLVKAEAPAPENATPP